MMHDPKEIGRWLQEQRRLCGLSQQELAAQFDVPPSTVALWESGQIKTPRVLYLAALSVFEFLLGDDEPKINPARLDQLRRLCHPDKHNNSPASNDATVWLNKVLANTKA